MSAREEALSEPRRFQVPAVSKVDGWYEVPMWVMHGRAIPYPRNCYTLLDGSVAKPGDWIEEGADGLLHIIRLKAPSP